MNTGDIAANDDHLCALGNALLLGYLAHMVERLTPKPVPPPLTPHEFLTEEDQAEQRMALGVLCDLWDAMSDAGAIYRLFKNNGLDPECSLDRDSCNWRDPPGMAWVCDLARSDEPIASLCLWDVKFTEAQSALLPITVAPYDLRARVVDLCPSVLSRVLAEFLIAYFLRPLEEPLSVQDAGNWGLRVVASEHVGGMALSSEAGQNGGGPRTGRNVKHEDGAADALGALYQARSAEKLRREDALSALSRFGFTARARSRIWEKGAGPNWKVAGKPGRGVVTISVGQVVEALRPALGAPLEPLAKQAPNAPGDEG